MWGMAAMAVKFWSLMICLSSGVADLSHSDQLVVEDLSVVHLSDARTMAHFQFTTTWDIHPSSFIQNSIVRHYGLFPKSLSEVVSHYQVQELHLSLTQGKWRTQVWGYPPVSVPPGAELWVWFLPQADAELQWSGLVNAMSGLLCAHLSGIGAKSTFQPLYSFKPQGAVFGNVSATQMRYAAVPRESVCTENFTPWTKLLPCGTSAGLGSLFEALVLFDADYHSLGLHFKPVCMGDCSRVGIELKQTLTVVFPPSLNRQGYIDWSLSSLFKKAVKGACPVSSQTRIRISTEDSGLSFSVTPEPASLADDGWFTYDLGESAGKFDVQVKSQSAVPRGMPAAPVLSAQRFLSGSGHEWGGLRTEITNSHASHSLKLLYFDMVPWFCRVFIHTLKVDNAELLYQHYQPAKDRERPHSLELFLKIPPQATAVISVEFNRAFLKWTEHPPDAHHGFYINSAVITAVLDECLNCSLLKLATSSSGDGTVLRVHTEALLVSLPTPDFSMPYNVICFVCTVIAIGFGSIFNLTTRRLEPATPENSRSLLQRVLARLKGGLKRKEEGKQASVKESDDNEASDQENKGTETQEVRESKEE